jgi:hypothetical protein
VRDLRRALHPRESLKHQIRYEVQEG